MPAQPYIKDFAKRLPVKAIENFTEAMTNFSKTLQALDLSPWQKDFANPFTSEVDELPYFNSKLYYVEGLLHQSLYGRSFLSYIQSTPKWISLAAERSHYDKAPFLQET